MRISLIIFTVMIASLSMAQKHYPCHTWKRYYSDCKIGFIDPEGRIMIEAQFENVTSFSDGRAFVWRYLDQKTEKAEVPLGQVYQNYERFGIGGNRETGIIDSTGKFIVEPKTNFILYSPYQDSIALVSIDNEVEIIDKNGKVMSNNYRHFYDAIVYKNLIIGRADHLQPLSRCYMTRTKQFVSGPYQTCEPFSEGYGAVKIGGKYGYVNLKGEMIIVPQYNRAGPFSNGYAVVSIEKTDINDHSHFTVLIDTTGRIIIGRGNNLIGKVSEGKIAYYQQVSDKAKYGFMDISGKMITQPIYDRVGTFVDGLAPVMVDDKYGYINSKGKMIIPARFTYAQDFKFGTAVVGIGKKKMGIINSKGELICEPWARKCH